MHLNSKENSTLESQVILVIIIAIINDILKLIKIIITISIIMTMKMKKFVMIFTSRQDTICPEDCTYITSKGIMAWL